jgi:hypothetical protein
MKLIKLLKEIVTEVSVEQLKTQFVDSGKISQKDFNEITNVTPKTAYITWLAKKVADKFIKTEDIYKYEKYFSIFDRRKKEYPFMDINQYKTLKDLSQFISKSVEISNKESEDISQQKGVPKIDKYKEFYIGSVDGFNVYKLPQGRKDLYGVSCELGSGTEWCTATGKTREHFDSYISQGPLFIFTKPGGSDKFQFHYETDSFMESSDESIYDIEWSEDEEKYIYNFFKFIEDNNPKYKIPTPFKLKYLLTYDPTYQITQDDIDNLADDEGNVNLDIYSLSTISLSDNLKIKGDLDLSNTLIASLPNNLKIKGDLYLYDTPIAEKYTEEQIEQMYPKLKGKINL